MAQLLEELTGHADNLVDGLYHVHRDTDSAGLVGDGARDGLTNPPRCVGGELESLCIIELFNSLDEAEIALLNEVKELHATAEIALRDADDKTQVRFGKALLCGFVAVLDGDGKAHFFFGGKQRHAADLFQVNFDRVIDGDAFHAHAGIKIVRICAGYIGKVDVINLDIAEVIDNLNAVRFQRIIEFFNVLRVEIQFADGVENLLCGELAFAFAELNQIADHGFLIGCCHSLSYLSCVFPYSLGSVCTLPFYLNSVLKHNVPIFSVCAVHRAAPAGRRGSHHAPYRYRSTRLRSK